MPGSRIKALWVAYGPGLLLTLILALMVLLRWVGAAWCSFWFDEIFSLKISQHTLPALRRYAALDVHPSTYYFLLHFVINVADKLAPGRAAVALLRLPSILPNLLLVLTLAWWAKSRWGRPAGWAMLVAAGFAPGMVYYSIELRNYSLAMLFVGLSCLSLIKLIAQPTRKWTILYVLFTLAYLNLHYVAMAIYGCQAIFHFAATRDQRRRGLAAAWWPALLPHGVILAILLPQLGQIWVKYRDYYVPANWCVYNAKFGDLFRTFVFDFPAGPQAVLSPQDRAYEWLAQGASLLFYAVLSGLWWRDRRQFPLADLDRITLRLCAWMLGAYLTGTWFVSVLKWSLVYSGFRTAMLVLSLWILLILTMIETGIRPRLRPLLRWSFALWMIPCALHATINRAHSVDDLRLLREYARINPNPSPGDAKPVFYLDDAQLVPWLRRVEGSIQIEPLAKLMAMKPLPSHPVRVVLHTATDLRVRLSCEKETVSYLRFSNRERGDTNKFASLSGFELYEFAPDEIPALVSELKKIATGKSTGWTQRLAH